MSIHSIRQYGRPRPDAMLEDHREPPVDFAELDEVVASDAPADGPTKTERLIVGAVLALVSVVCILIIGSLAVSVWRALPWLLKA